MLVSDRQSQSVGTTIDAGHAWDAEEIGGLDTDGGRKIEIFSVPILLRNIYERFKRHDILYRLQSSPSRLSYGLARPERLRFSGGRKREERPVKRNAEE